MDRKTTFERLVERHQKLVGSTDKYDYNITIQEDQDSKPMYMSIGVLTPPKKKSNKEVTSAPSCSRTGSSTLANVKSTPIPFSRCQIVKNARPMPRLVKSMSLKETCSSTYTNQALAGASQPLNIHTKTCTDIKSKVTTPNPDLTKPNQEAQGPSPSGTKKSVIKFIQSKGADSSQSSSQYQGRGSSQIQPEMARSENVSSGNLQKQRSIKILRRNLTALDGDSTKKAIPTTSVEYFMEQDILEKGIEVLDSLDDQSLKVLVNRVMDLTNKMYGDYLAEELGKHLGPEKYMELADEGITTFRAFLAKKHYEVSKENLPPTGSTSGTHSCVDTDRNVSIPSPKQANKMPGFVKIDPKMIRSPSNLHVHFKDVETDQKNVAKKRNSLCQSSSRYKIEASSSLGRSPFSSDFDNQKRTSQWSSTSTKPEDVVIDTSKINEFSLKDNMNSIVEEVISQEEKTAADIFISNKIAKLKKIDSSIINNIEDNFTFDESKNNRGPPEKIFESPEDLTEVQVPGTSFPGKCLPRKLLQVDGEDKTNAKQEEMPPSEKSVTELSSADHEKTSWPKLRINKQPVKVEDKFNFDPLLSSPSKHVPKNKSIISSPEMSFASTSTISVNSPESLGRIQEHLFQTPDVAERKVKAVGVLCDTLQTKSSQSNEERRSVLIKKIDDEKPIPQIVKNIRIKYFEKINKELNKPVFNITSNAKPIGIEERNPGTAQISCANVPQVIGFDKIVGTNEGSPLSSLRTRKEDQPLTREQSLILSSDQLKTDSKEAVKRDKDKLKSVNNEIRPPQVSRDGKPLPNLKKLETVKRLEQTHQSRPVLMSSQGNVHNSKVDENFLDTANAIKDEKPLVEVQQCEQSVTDPKSQMKKFDQTRKLTPHDDDSLMQSLEISKEDLSLRDKVTNSKQQSLKVRKDSESSDIESSMIDLARLLMSLQDSAASSSDRTLDSSGISNESFETFAHNTVKSFVIESDDCILIENGKSTRCKVIKEERSAQEPFHFDDCKKGHIQDAPKIIGNGKKDCKDDQLSNSEPTKFINEAVSSVCDGYCVLVEEKSPITKSSQVLTIESDVCMFVEVESVPSREKLQQCNESNKCSPHLSCSFLKGGASEKNNDVKKANESLKEASAKNDDLKEVEESLKESLTKNDDLNKEKGSLKAAPTKNDHLKKATDSLKEAPTKNDVKSAKDSFKEASTHNNDVKTTNSLLNVAWTKNNDVKKSKESLKEATAKNDDVKKANGSLKEAPAKNDMKNAKDSAKKASTHNNDVKKATDSLLKGVSTKNNDVKKAKESLKETTEKNDDVKKANDSLKEAPSKNDDFKIAKESLKEAMAKNDDVKKAKDSLTEAPTKNDVKNAKDSAKKASTHNNDVKKATHSLLKGVSTKNNDVKKAKESLKEATVKNDDFKKAKESLKEAMAKNDDVKKANDSLKEAPAKNDDFKIAKESLKEAMAKNDDVKKAKDSLTEAPTKNDVKNAKDSAKKASTHNNDVKKATHSLLKGVSTKNNNVKKAKESLKEATAKNDDFKKAKESLKEVMTKNDDVKKANDSLKEAPEKNDDFKKAKLKEAMARKDVKDAKSSFLKESSTKNDDLKNARGSLKDTSPKNDYVNKAKELLLKDTSTKNNDVKKAKDSFESGEEYEHSVIKENPCSVREHKSYEELSIRNTKLSPCGTNLRKAESSKCDKCSASVSRDVSQKSLHSANLEASRALETGTKFGLNQNGKLGAPEMEPGLVGIKTKDCRKNTSSDVCAEEDDDCIFVGISGPIGPPSSRISWESDARQRCRRVRKVRMRTQRNFLKKRGRMLSRAILYRIQRTYSYLKTVARVINMTRSDVGLDNFTLKCKINKLKTIHRQVIKTFLTLGGGAVENMQVACRKMCMLYCGRTVEVGKKRRNVKKKEEKLDSPVKVKDKRADVEETGVLFNSPPQDDTKATSKPYRTYGSKARKNILNTGHEADVGDSGKNIKPEEIFPYGGVSFFDEIRKSSLYRDECVEDNEFESIPTRGTMPSPEMVVVKQEPPESPPVKNFDPLTPVIVKQELLETSELKRFDPFTRVVVKQEFLDTPEFKGSGSLKRAVVKQEPPETPELKRCDTVRRGRKRKASSNNTRDKAKKPRTPKPLNLNHAEAKKPERSAKKKKERQTPDVHSSYSLRSRLSGNST